MRATTSPTQTLREEHRVILRAIALLEVAAGRLGDGRPLPDGWWNGLLDWLRAFADLNHHGKEERYLFPALAQAGIPADGGPVSVMLEEHTEGRALVQVMAGGAPDRHTEGRALVQVMAGGAPDRRAEAARRYGHLLRDHIDKENGVLLPLAEAVLDPQAQLLLARGFEKVEAEQGPAAFIELAEAEVDQLAAALGAQP